MAVGFNLSYGIWFGRAGRRPEDLRFALRGFKLLDDRYANPAYLLHGVTGGVMVAMSGLPPATPWLAASTALWLVAVVVAYTVYTPALRACIAEVEATLPVPAARDVPPGDPAGGDGAAWRVALTGQFLGVLIVAVLILMVFKPGT